MGVLQTIIATASATVSGGGGGGTTSPGSATFTSVSDGGYGYWLNNDGSQTPATVFGGSVGMNSYTFPDGSSGTPYTLSGGYAIGPLINNLGSNEITINIWFYPLSNNIQIVSELESQNPTSGYHYTILEIDSSGHIHGRFWPNGGTGMATANTVTLNAWNHVWYTNNSSGYEQLQLNGGAIATQTVSARQGPGTSSFAFGYSDSTDLDGNVGTTRSTFQGKIGYFQYKNDATTGSNYSSTWGKYNSFSVVDSLTSLGTSWSVEVIGEFYPSQYWATIWGNEVWNSGTGHLAYFTGSTNLVVGRPNAQFEYTMTQPISTRAYWVFTHTDGGGIDVYRNGTLLTPYTSNYTQPTPANNTLIWGARHGNDGTGTTDPCPGNYLYTNIVASALSPATITSNFSMLQGTYSIP